MYKKVLDMYICVGQLLRSYLYSMVLFDNLPSGSGMAYKWVPENYTNSSCLIWVLSHQHLPRSFHFARHLYDCIWWTLCFFFTLQYIVVILFDMSWHLTSLQVCLRAQQLLLVFSGFTITSKVLPGHPQWYFWLGGRGIKGAYCNQHIQAPQVIW